MADLSKTVEIIFAGKDQVGDSITSIGGKLDGLGASIESAAAPFAKLANGVLAADTALAAMAVGGIALAINSAGKFQDSFNEIISISGATGDSIGKFHNDIISYAQGSTQSIDKINASVYDAISAGIKYSDSLDLVKVSEKLAVAGRADLDATTLLMVSTMNAYGASTDQAQKYSDVFFQTVKIGQTTVPELASSLANVSGIASSAGVPIETLGAAIAALTASGIKTPEAMTGIKAALENMIKPSSECKAAAAALGIQFDAGALKSKGFEGVLKDVISATGGNIEKMSGLFGSVEALNAALILGTDKTGTFKGALDAMKASTGSTDEAYKVMANNMSLATQNLKNNVEVVLIDIGERILPKFGTDVNSLAQVFKSVKFAIDSGAFDPVFAVLDEAGAKIKTALDTIAKNFPEAMKLVNFDDLIRALKDLGGSFGTLFDSIDLSSPEGLAKAIQGVVDTITSLIDITSGMVDAFKPVFDSITSTVGGFNELDSASKKAGGEVLATAKLIVDAGLAIAGAVAVIAATGADMKGVFDVVFGTVQLAWNTLKGTIEAVVIVFVTALDTLVTSLDSWTLGYFREDLTKTSESLNAFKDKMNSAFVEDANDSLDGLQKVDKGFKELGLSAEGVTEDLSHTKSALQAVPDKKEILFAADYETALDNIKKMTTGLDGLPLKRDISITAKADKPSISDAENQFAWTVDERRLKVVPWTDQVRLSEAKKTIEDNIPIEKKLPILAYVDEAQIKAKTTEIENYFDFEAKIDIDQLETAAKVMEAAFDTSNLDEVNKGLGDLGNSAGVASGKVESAGRALQALPSQKDTKIVISDEDALSSIRSISTGLSKIDTSARIDLTANVDPVTKALQQVSVGLDKVTGDKFTILDAKPDPFLSAVKTVFTELNKVPTEKSTSLTASVDEAAMTKAKNSYSWTTDERGVTIITLADDKKIAETKKTIEDNIPPEKKLTIQAEIDKEQIKAKTDQIKSYFDFKAKVDVAQLEASAKVMEAAFGSINVVMSETTKSIGALAPLLDPHNINWTNIYDLVQQEIAMQQQAVDSQGKLIDAQIKYLEARAAAVDRGDAMITIQGDGLKPELEAFMFKILETVQVRVAQEHAEFLLGMGTA